MPAGHVALAVGQRKLIMRPTHADHADRDKTHTQDNKGVQKWQIALWIAASF